jgi:hypothetical protein
VLKLDSPGLQAGHRLAERLHLADDFGHGRAGGVRRSWSVSGKCRAGGQPGYEWDLSGLS